MIIALSVTYLRNNRFRTVITSIGIGSSESRKYTVFATNVKYVLYTKDPQISVLTYSTHLTNMVLT